MKKVLFLIHDLGPGGAEKVLVNLVNNLDPQQFDITVMALFGGGVNEQFLKPHIRYITCFKHMIRGNSHLMKLLTPRQLHNWLIKEHYDIEIAYLEGPSTRIISGCPRTDTKKVAWVHCTVTKENAVVGFRSLAETEKAYGTFDEIICVSENAKRSFAGIFTNIRNVRVLYNTNESARIMELASEMPEEPMDDSGFRLITMGKLMPVKAYDRLIRIHARLRQMGLPVYTDILGSGSLRQELERLCRDLGVQDSVRFLGYQTNPYKYVARSDLYVCSSLSEGFSTAATEALILGVPVCTVEVSGMKEMLGAHNEYGIVTENDEDALYEGIKSLLSDPDKLAHYKCMAALRGKDFSTEKTVKAVEEMLSSKLKRE